MLKLSVKCVLQPSVFVFILLVKVVLRVVSEDFNVSSIEKAITSISIVLFCSELSLFGVKDKTDYTLNVGP